MNEHARNRYQRTFNNTLYTRVEIGQYPKFMVQKKGYHRAPTLSLLISLHSQIETNYKTNIS
jgi:hypothetical protein